MEEERRRTVGYPFGVEAADDAQIVGNLRHRREEIGNPKAALPTPRKLPQRLHDALGRALPRLGEAAEVAKRHLLAVVGREPRLGVEAVDLAHPSSHEQEDHPLGAEGKVRADRGGGMAGVEAGPGQRSESATGTPKCRTPRQDDR